MATDYLNAWASDFRMSEGNHPISNSIAAGRS